MAEFADAPRIPGRIGKELGMRLAKKIQGMISQAGTAALLTAALVSVLLSAPATLVAQTESGASVVYLVRHAEKATDGDPSDPLLSTEGAERAELVAHMLADVPLTTIISTPFIRTLTTAGPTAMRHGLEITEYDPRSREAVAGLVETLRTTPGHHLVVGHSNTTPEMVEALGGDPLTPIDEPGEYDRLYIVTIAPDGSVSSSMIRFGVPFTGAGDDSGH